MVGQEGTVLSSSRVLLRPFRQDDYPSYLQITSDPEVTKFLGGAISKETITNHFHSVISGEKVDRITWAIVENDVMKFVGFTSLGKVDNQTGEIRITMDPAYWGKDLANQALALCLDFAASQNEFKSILANIHPDNKGAKKLFHKLSFKYRRSIFVKGKPLDQYEYVVEGSD